MLLGVCMFRRRFWCSFWFQRSVAADGVFHGDAHHIPQGFSALPLWCFDMEILSTLLVLCQGNSTVTGGIPSQRPVMRGFDFRCSWPERTVRVDSAPWFETPWRSFDVTAMTYICLILVTLQPWWRLILPPIPNWSTLQRILWDWQQSRRNLFKYVSNVSCINC